MTAETVADAARAMIWDLLERHQPVNGNPDCLKFQVEPATCVCGRWAGWGSLFNDHRARVIAAAIDKAFFGAVEVAFQ